MRWIILVFACWFWFCLGFTFGKPNAAVVSPVAAKARRIVLYLLFVAAIATTIIGGWA